MDEFVKIADLKNDVEAGLLDSILTERGIPHMIRSYFDAAYDGMFQTQRGWGCVLAYEEHAEDVQAVLSDLRTQASEPTPDESATE